MQQSAMHKKPDKTGPGLQSELLAGVMVSQRNNCTYPSSAGVMACAVVP
jgi:hypothetical protein